MSGSRFSKTNIFVQKLFSEIFNQFSKLEFSYLACTIWMLLQNQTNQTKIAANLAIYAAICISIDQFDHFLCLIII